MRDIKNRLFLLKLVFTGSKGAVALAWVGGRTGQRYR